MDSEDIMKPPIGKVFCHIRAKSNLGELKFVKSQFLTCKITLLISWSWCSQNYMRKWKYAGTWSNNRFFKNVSSLGPLCSFQSYDFDYSLEIEAKELHVKTFVYFLIIKGIQSKLRIKSLPNCLELFCKSIILTQSSLLRRLKLFLFEKVPEKQ